MKERPLRTTVIGSYPFPSWLEHAAEHLDAFGPDDIAEMQDDAVVAALGDQVRAGLDVVTDGEQTRFDFNLSFYGYLEGIDLESAPPRRFGPPPTTSGDATQSLDCCKRRTAWARWRSLRGSSDWHQQGRRSRPACRGPTR